MNEEDWFGFDNDNHGWYYLGKYTCYDDLEYDHDTSAYGMLKTRMQLEIMVMQINEVLLITERAV